MHSDRPLSSSGPGTRTMGELGSVYAEYLVLLVVVSLGASAGLAAAGVPLVRMFVNRQLWLLLPFP